MDCGSLTGPANGSVNHTAGTTIGQTATYSCNTGYSLVGNSTLTCQAAGNWSGRAPTCEPMLIKGNVTLFMCVCTQKHVFSGKTVFLPISKAFLPRKFPAV